MPRPPNPEPHSRKLFNLADPMWEEVARYRHHMRFSSEVEAVRRLLRVGLDVEQRRVARGETRARRKRSGD